MNVGQFAQGEASRLVASRFHRYGKKGQAASCGVPCDLSGVGHEVQVAVGIEEPSRPLARLVPVASSHTCRPQLSPASSLITRPAIICPIMGGR